jgi:hypothetical protein
MDTRRLLKLAALSCAALALISGCLAPVELPPAVSWGLKVQDNKLTTTTAEEWQAIANKLNSRVPEADIQLPEEAAEVIVKFLQLNELDSLQEAINLAQQAKNDPSIVEELKLPEGVTEEALPEGVQEFFDALAATDADAFVQDLAATAG